MQQPPQSSPQSFVRVHRCRFATYRPSAINVLAFDPEGHRVCVGRENGDLELWSVRGGHWYTDHIIPGVSQHSVRSIVWNIMGLYTAGINGTIVEWSLSTLKPRNMCDSYGGAVWQLAANPQDESMLAAACEDGSIRLFKVGDDPDIGGTGIVYNGSLSKHKGRCLSVCFAPPSSSSSSSSSSKLVLVSGGVDGSVRVWDVSSKQCRVRITIDRVSRTIPMVWCVRVLNDEMGTIISGDSLGRVQFWDSRHGTLLQSFKSHQADVLALAVAADDIVFATGVDSEIVQFRRVPTTARTRRVESQGIHSDASLTVATKWVRTTTQRPTAHDTRALAVSPLAADGSNAGHQMLVAGGVDMRLTCYRVRRFPQSARAVAPFTCRPIMSVAPAKRFVATWMDRCLHIHRWGRVSSTWDLDAPVNHAQVPLVRGHEHLLSMELDGSNLSCATISPDGQWLAASDPYQLRLFRLYHSDTLNPSNIGVEKCDLAQVAAMSAYSLTFSADSLRMIIGTLDGRVVVYNVVTSSVECTFADHHTAMIKTLAVSDCGKWLAAGDIDDNVHTFDMVQLKHHAHVAIGSLPHTALAIMPKNPTLVVTYASNKFNMVSIQENRVTGWSRENGEQLPNQLTHRLESLSGVTFNPAQPNTLLLTASSFLCHVSLLPTVPLSSSAAAVGDASAAASNVVVGDKRANDNATSGSQKQKQRNKKKRRQSNGSVSSSSNTNNNSDGGGAADADGTAANIENNFTIVERYQPMIGCQFVGDNELVVLELEWMKVMAELPGAFARKQYGT